MSYFKVHISRPNKTYGESSVGCLIEAGASSGYYPPAGPRNGTHGGREDWMEANRGSDRKSAMTGVGWLYGLLPAKREKASRERLPVSPTLPNLFYFIYLCQRLGLKMHLSYFLDLCVFTTLVLRRCPLLMNNSIVFI